MQLAGELDELAGRIRWLLELAEQHALAMYGSLAGILESWLRVVREGTPDAADTMQDHVDRRLRMGTAFEQTYHYMLMADARLRLGQVQAAMAAAREGLTRAERTGERLRVAELHRLTAACHRAGSGDDPGAAEIALHAALTVARQQGARMWELRAGCDLARLWAEQGERQKAHELLAPVYGWFTEGFRYARPESGQGIARRAACVGMLVRCDFRTCTPKVPLFIVGSGSAQEFPVFQQCPVSLREQTFAPSA